MRFRFENAALQAEPADGQVNDGLDRIPGASRVELGLGEIRAPVRSDDQIDARFDNVERRKIDLALENRDDLQLDGHRSGMKQRRLLGRFGPVDGEAGGFDAKMAPIERDAADLHAPAGGCRNFGRQLAPHDLAEPIAAHRQLAGQGEDGGQNRRRPGDNQGQARAGHSKASSW